MKMKRILQGYKYLSWIAVITCGIALLIGCNNTLTSVLPTQSPLPTPLSGNSYSVAELKYILIDHFGGMGAGPEPGIHFCDPELFPVAQGIAPERLTKRYLEIRNDTDSYRAILTHLGLDQNVELTMEQKQLLYYEDNRLNALNLDLTKEPYAFELLVRSTEGAMQVTGTISRSGIIAIQQSSVVQSRLSCPICLPGNARIATPYGEIPIKQLHTGMVIWTTDKAGRRIEARIQQTSRIPIEKTHPFIQISLNDGRRVTASPNHPLADGRTFAQLQIGDQIEDRAVIAVEHIVTEDIATYDILPVSDTGTYWANGVLLRSTLFNGMNHH